MKVFSTYNCYLRLEDAFPIDLHSHPEQNVRIASVTHSLGTERVATHTNIDTRSDSGADRIAYQPTLIPASYIAA